MIAGVFGTLLFLALVIADWFHFTSLTPSASHYGCPVARVHDRLDVSPTCFGLYGFDAHGVLQLSHGIARLAKAERRILLRPQYHLFSRRFRTAWPLKGTIEWQADGAGTHVICTKRVPWSSAILTLVWFLLVGMGTLAFLVSYISQGGFATLSGVAMGVGITAIGAVVLAFGLIIVALAYRLEDHRLMQTYTELRTFLNGDPVGTP